MDATSPASSGYNEANGPPCASLPPCILAAARLDPAAPMKGYEHPWDHMHGHHGPVYRFVAGDGDDDEEEEEEEEGDEDEEDEEEDEDEE